MKLGRFTLAAIFLPLATVLAETAPQGLMAKTQAQKGDVARKAQQTSPGGYTINDDCLYLTDNIAGNENRCLPVCTSTDASFPVVNAKGETDNVGGQTMDGVCTSDSGKTCKQGIPEALVDANLYDCDAAPNSLNNDKNPLSVGSNSYCKEFYNSVVVTNNPGVPPDNNGDRVKAAGSCARCFLKATEPECTGTDWDHDTIPDKCDDCPWWPQKPTGPDFFQSPVLPPVLNATTGILEGCDEEVCAHPDRIPGSKAYAACAKDCGNGDANNCAYVCGKFGIPFVSACQCSNMGGITSKTVPTVGNDKWLYNTLIETYGVVNITDGTRKASFNDICAVANRGSTPQDAFKVCCECKPIEEASGCPKK